MKNSHKNESFMKNDLLWRVEYGYPHSHRPLNKSFHIQVF